MDMNGLKEINDTQGHAAGDEQLRVTAREIRKAFRPDDVIARIGGDEFVIILPETNTGAAQLVVDRLTQIIEEINQQNPDRNPISFAIGFASSESMPDLQNVLRKADREMYVQKAKYYAGNKSYLSFSNEQ